MRRARGDAAGVLGARLIWIGTALALAAVVLYPVAMVVWGAVRDVHVAGRVLGSGATWRAAGNTLLMAVAATLVATLMAVPMAWSCARTDLPLRRHVRGLVFLTFMNPPILLGFAYVVLLGPNEGLVNQALRALGLGTVSVFSWWGLVLTTVCTTYPIVFMATAAALENLDPDLEEAGLAHGATPGRVATAITLRLVVPSILSGALLAYVIALNSFGIQALIAIPANIPLLTTVIYSYFSYPVQLTAASDLAVILIAISAVSTVAVNAVVAATSYSTIGGKGLKPAAVTLRAPAKLLLLALNGGVVMVTLVAPMLVILATSFLKSLGGGFRAANLTLAGYRALLALGDVLPALGNSFALGASAAVLMTLLALSLAYFGRQRMPGARAAAVVAEIPFVIPGIVLAIGFIFAYGAPPFLLYGTRAILLLAYVAKFLPIALRFAQNAFAQVGLELEESVYAHGGSRLDAFLKVLLPLTRPGVVAAAVISFVFAFNELSSSILLVGPGTQVSSTVLLHYSEEGLLESMSAFAAILFAVTATSYAVVARVVGRSFLQSL